MSAYFLVIYIYAGMLAKGDSVAMLSVPQPSLEACHAAGKKAAELVSGSAKDLRFLCIKGQ